MGSGYRCGQKASLALADFIAHRPVDCVEVDRDRYHRAVAVCTVQGVDLADWLVRGGLALDWPQYSKGGYAQAQKAAQHGHLGLWGGSFSPLGLTERVAGAAVGRKHVRTRIMWGDKRRAISRREIAVNRLRNFPL